MLGVINGKNKSLFASKCKQIMQIQKFITLSLRYSNILNILTWLVYENVNVNNLEIMPH